MPGLRGAPPAVRAAHEAPEPPRPGTRRSLGTYLVAIIALQAVLFAALVLFASDRSYRNAIQQSAAASATTARTAADMIGRSVDDVAELMADEAARSDLAGVFGSAQSCALTGGRSGPFSSEMHVVGGDGTLRCTSLSPSSAIDRRAYANSAWLATVRRSAVATPVIAGPLVDPLTRRDVVVIAARLAKTDGVIVTTLDLASAADGLLSRLGGPAGQFFMVTTSDRQTVLAQTGRPAAGPIDAGFSQRLAAGDPVVADPDGVARILGEATVEFGSSQRAGGDWRVWAGVSTAEALAGARDTFRTTVLFALAALLIVLIAAFVIRRRITQPVVKLARSVDDASGGDASVRIPTDGPREIANLAERVNHLLDVRQGAEEVLVRALRVEREANDRLRELDGMKNTFLMALSHELRTPLTAIVGFSSLLEDDIVDGDEYVDVVQRIAAQSRRLERILLDMLDVDRMSRGVLEPNRQDVSLRDLVQRVIEMGSFADRVSNDIAGDVVAYVDIALMERVVENLVTNAVKHTSPSTQIWIRSERSRDGVILIVDDAGPGVPEDIREHIFEAFAQGDVPEHAPGTGIGLALVSEFAKLHGARAWVEDRDGKGASFRVALPGKPRAKKRRRAPRTPHRAA